MCRILLEAGAAVDYAGDSHWTPLQWAASSGHSAAVLSLLEHGALAAKADDEGFMAIDLAEKWEHGVCADVIRAWCARQAAMQAFDPAAAPSAPPIDRAVGQIKRKQQI